MEFSLSAFFSKNRTWILANLGLHLALAFDEAIRMRLARLRWPFLLNHLLFLLSLALLL